ncbi:hypothetical protein [Glycomyces buryatensis]|uniref:Uncharacterized protein n=1 Tax=Glycomyces buryatensis TaxID=2570927 RepID=A0A4V4HSM8_9ACTN|nr:hypothetical protein [Glycomyces buryatensis]THV42356.1 hypothetical protein FAB82_06780 [Glycomyces buryatensis]
MSRTHRAAEPHGDIAPRRPADEGAPPQAAGPPPPEPQWSPIGSQTEGLAAIRAVWERAGETERRIRPGRPVQRKGPKPFAPALAGVLICACVLMFLAWVSAPALWMSLGHSETGTVTVTSCREGFAPSCDGLFEAASAGWTKELRLTGSVTATDVGDVLIAETTGPDASSAYVGGLGGLIWRWAPGLVLFMVFGFVLVAASGANRLFDGRGQAIGLCWAATGAVLVCALAFAW